MFINRRSLDIFACPRVEFGEVNKDSHSTWWNSLLPALAESLCHLVQINFHATSLILTHFHDIRYWHYLWKKKKVLVHILLATVKVIIVEENSKIFGKFHKKIKICPLPKGGGVVFSLFLWTSLQQPLSWLCGKLNTCCTPMIKIHCTELPVWFSKFSSQTESWTNQDSQCLHCSHLHHLCR